MRVLVVGASGFIGSILLETLCGDYEVVGTYFSNPVAGLLHLDMTKRGEVQAMLTGKRPDVILQPAMQPNVDHCEIHRDETWAINVGGTANLIDVAKALGTRYVYFSSDYVFDGRAGPYSETDAPNPINVYGQEKLACEKLIQTELDDYLIIRTTVVYGWEQAAKNFIASLIYRLRIGQHVRVPADQVGSPTYVRNLALAVRELLIEGYGGIVHVAGSDVMDRYTFARLAAEVFDLSKDLVLPVATDQLKQAARRPLQAGLQVEKAQKVLKVPLLGVVEGLQAMKYEEN